MGTSFVLSLCFSSTGNTGSSFDSQGWQEVTKEYKLMEVFHSLVATKNVQLILKHGL